MACEQFRDCNLRSETRAIINKANQFLSEYGSGVTLRHLYYRFVAADAFPDSWIDHEYNNKNHLAPSTKNTLKNYKRLGAIISDGRYAGLIDWEALDDPGREPDLPSEWPSLSSLVDSAARAFRLPRWEGQDYHVEIWVEKEGQISLLAPLARQYHVPLIANKGYGSASSMKIAADRIIAACDADSVKRPVILYLGDHDPSGEDMVRDVHDRLTEFGVLDLEVRKVALTMEQIRQFNPPPNPAKVTDSRAKAYIAKYGDESWELEALPPPVVDTLLRAELVELVDQELMDRVLEREKAALKKLRQAVKGL